MTPTLPPLLAQLEGDTGTGIGLGPAASTFAHDVDPVWNFLFWVSVFFTVLIIALMVLFAWKYRQKDRNDRGRGASHSTALEIGWTLPPLILVLAFFAFGFRGYVDMSTIPDEGQSQQVLVEAYKWGWNFQYVTESGVVNSSVLYVPNDRPTSLVLQSSDVIHSFYVPKFRIKKDCVPGRYNRTWFNPTRNGEYDLFCAEYCGTLHSAMYTKVVVMDREDFEAKMEELNDPFLTPPVELGIRVHQQQCIACHSIDGSDNFGPTWKNLYNKEHKVLVNGETESITADDYPEYLRLSILYPNQHKVLGYENQPMQSYLGILKEPEIFGVIEYIKQLSLKTAENPEGTYTGPIIGGWSDEAKQIAPDADFDTLMEAAQAGADSAPPDADDAVSPE